jgi:hypothetical protein
MAPAAWLSARGRPADAAAEVAFDEAAKAYALKRPASHPAHAALALLRADLHAALRGQAEARGFG